MRAPRARRSELATPASSERMCEKAAASGADLVFLDLEDACAPAVKDPRGVVVGALTGLDWGRTVRAVRVNGIDTPWCHGDIIDVVTGARESLDVLIVPKVRRARDVWWVDVLLGQLEASLRLARPIGLEVLIEEAEGLANAVEIAESSERLEALIFGAGDLSARSTRAWTATSIPSCRIPGDFWHFARMQVLTAARAGMVDAVDAPYPAYQDPEGYRQSRSRVERTRLRRQVGDPPRPGPDRQRGLLADSRRGGRGRRGSPGLPPGRGRRSGGHRPGRPVGRRRPHAAGGQYLAQGGPGRGGRGRPAAVRKRPSQPGRGVLSSRCRRTHMGRTR